MGNKHNVQDKWPRSYTPPVKEREREYDIMYPTGESVSRLLVQSRNRWLLPHLRVRICTIVDLDVSLHLHRIVCFVQLCLHITI